MKRWLLLFVCTGVTFCVWAQTNDNTWLKQILKGEYNARGVAEQHSMSDGEYYTVRSADSTAILRYEYKSGKLVDTLFSTRTARECGFRKFSDYEFSADETKILIATAKESIFRHSFRATYFVFERKRNLISPLSKGGKQQMATFSPNGRMVAFVRDANIYLVKLDYGTESAVTKDGEPGKITYGLPDWVYEEEFSFNKAFEWSPDNGFIAFMRFDQSNVPDFSIPMYKGLRPEKSAFATYPGAESVKYPKAGQPNSKVTVQTFNVLSRVVKNMEISDPDVEYVPRIRFMPQPDQLAVFTLNRQQNKFVIYSANPRSGLTRTLIREENEAYIDNDNFDMIQFLSDRIIYVSEKDGFRHLYEYSINGVLRKQLTKGEWAVTGFHGYDPTRQVYYYTSNEGSPLRSSLYSLDYKGKKGNLTPEPGTHGISFSANFSYFTDNYSTANIPDVVTVRNWQGKTCFVAEANTALKNKLSKLALSTKEFFSFTTTSGVSLNGWMVKPAGFSSTKQYPVVMVQYGGPGSQQVKDAYRLDWEQYLAAKGYLVVCVDGRGTGGRGEKFSKQTYMRLGLKEAEDQIETARYLSAQPFVDKSKIAIWGWSYGGYNVLMSMSLGKGVFRAGIAVAPVTDWRFYDSVYAERYMRTPGENMDGYNLSAPGTYAADLQGALLLVHGTADDNVHYQNTAEYAEQLVQAGKPFDMQIYTNRNHYIKGGNTRLHLYERFLRFLDQNMR